MAIDVAELTILRDGLIRLRAKGVRSGQINGERVEFATDSEMAAKIASLTSMIDAGQDSGGFAIAYPTTGRGL
ncbi:MAG: hypothetical protein JNN06_01310 [Gemmobacter sp.]|uniref:phage head-tail joining protein n=1 Tax=Gemmobacter sp. TaxID=1898957 RepID=UPI001A5F241F|nr:hypothetical protein [Gemmobacter sp.]MBL8560892.1 hypothetical protein [Gemmobacter sp.]